MFRQIFNRFVGILPWGDSGNREAPPEPEEHRREDIGPPVHQSPVEEETTPPGSSRITKIRGTVQSCTWNVTPEPEDVAGPASTDDETNEDLNTYEGCEDSLTLTYDSDEMSDVDVDEDAQTEIASELSPEELFEYSSTPPGSSSEMGEVDMGTSAPLATIVEQEEREKVVPMIRRSSRLTGKGKKSCGCCNGGSPPRAGFRVPQQ